MNPSDFNFNLTGCYNPATHKVVPKDAVVLDGEYLSEWTSIERLVQSLRGHGYRRLAKQIEAQTKPPRIPEPGVWGVVEAKGPDDAVLRKYVRNASGRWFSCASNGASLDWEELLNPTLIRPGV